MRVSHKCLHRQVRVNMGSMTCAISQSFDTNTRAVAPFSHLYDATKWVVGPSAPWGPSEDGHHLAIYEWSLRSRMSMRKTYLQLGPLRGSGDKEMLQGVLSGNFGNIRNSHFGSKPVGGYLNQKVQHFINVHGPQRPSLIDALEISSRKCISRSE